MKTKFVLSTFVFALSLSLTGCAVVGDGQDGVGGNGLARKPSSDDLKGVVSDFSGTWKGTCKYETTEKTSSSCVATLQIEQDSSMITATLTYVIDGGGRNKTFTRYGISGNELSMPGTSGGAGKIGTKAFVLYDNDVVQLSGLMNGKTMGVVASRLPGSGLGATKVVSGFTASLQLAD